MRKREQLLRESIKNVRGFLDEYIAEVPRLARWHEKFIETNKRLEDLFFDHLQAVADDRLRAAPVRILATKVRERFLLRIARTGRPLLRRVAGAERAMKVPPKRANSAEIADSADRLGAFLKPKARRLFVEAGFEAEFWVAFDENRSALRKAVRQAATESGKAGKIAMLARAALREARADVDVLEGVLAPFLADDKVMRHMWERAKRVPRALGRPTDARRRRRAGSQSAETADGTPT